MAGGAHSKQRIGPDTPINAPTVRSIRENRHACRRCAATRSDRQDQEFRAFGPKYEVGPLLRPLEDGDWMVQVKMVETGEGAEYRWAHLLDDPEGR